MHYTPIYNTNVSFRRDEIDRLFLVNRRLLDVTMRGITQEEKDSIPQPRIIIGAEGTGKSWMLKAICDLLKEEHREFLPFYFDASEVCSLQDFVALLSSIHEEGRRVVVLADNIDNLFSQLTEQEQYVLRGKLNTNGAPILVCSAKKTPKVLTDYTSAFFDGFDVMYIDRLSMDTAWDIAGATNDKQRKRADKLLSVVGTEIRNVMMVSNILSMSSSVEMDRQILFDSIYEASQMKLHALPRISQQIITSLANGESKSLPELRESLGVESSKLSPYITQLVAQGILVKEEETIRKSKYSLADNKLRFYLSYCREK